MVISLNRKYNDAMNILKKFLYQGTGVAFKLLLILVPIIFALAIVLGTPKHIETALKESRVYDQIVGVVINNSQKNAEGDTQKVLQQPEIKAAAEKAFNPEVLQGATENFLDGMYAWLQGKTPEPQFSIDLTAPKNELVQGVTDYAKNRANSLPVCTLQQLQLLSPDMDLLSLPCLPPGTNVQATADTFAQQFQDGADFLDKPVITNETIAKNNNAGKSIDQELEGAPQAYQNMQTGKWVLLLIAAALGALLILARHNRRAGIRHVAWGMLGAATFLVIAQIVYWFMFDKANQGGDATQAMVLDGVKALLRELNKILLLFAAAYAVVGGGLLVLLHTKSAPKKLTTDPLIGEPELSRAGRLNKPDAPDKKEL